MPLFENHNLHGDLYVEYSVVLPVEISSQTRRSGFHINTRPTSKTDITDSLFLTELSEAFQVSGSGHDEL